MTDILRLDPTLPAAAAIVAAALVLKAGGVVVLPTDTVYAVAADLNDAAAVRRIYQLKNRPDAKALPVLIGDRGQLDELAADVPPAAAALLDYYWPGPLTLIFNKKPGAAAAASAGLPTVAVRRPGTMICQAILAEAGTPLASSSANLSGGIPPRDLADVAPAITAGVDLIVDGGVCPDGQASTILDVSGPIWRVLRQGRVTRAAIETAVGRVVK